jgi:uncharacterized protein YwqG
MTTTNLSTSTVVHSAACSLEERELIAAIVDNLTDLEARNRYEAWLTERNDPRASLASSLTRATEAVLLKDGGNQNPFLQDPFLRGEGYSESWCALLGLPFVQCVTLHEEFRKAREIALRHARITLDIRSEAVAAESLTLLQSRFGGRAALPKDVPWPECDEGPLSFLGQISLKEIELTQAARLLPAGGWLSFFALGDRVGAGAEGLKDCQVFYAGPEAKVEYRDPPAGTELSTDPCRLIFTEGFDLPDGQDFVVSEEDQSALKEINEWFDFDEYRNPWRKGDHHLFGYARHYRTSDPSPGANWVNLLCLGSSYGTGWNWCDGEHLAIFIEDVDLKQGRFDRVFGYAS